MFAYSTPGAYYERVDAGAPVVAPVRMDIAGFVGIARRGPLHLAVPVESWRQFVAHFGDVTGAGYLAYAVRGFFENGGRRCWVVRVASDAAASAGLSLPLSGGGMAWRVSASSPGVWGDDLSVRVTTLHRSQTTTVPTVSSPEYTVVTSVTGFERATHVRIVQPDGTIVLRVVSAVDSDARRLYWVHPKPQLRLPYDAPVTGLDPNVPAIVESIEHRADVRERGRLVASYDRLSLVPEHPRYGPTALRPLTIDPSRPSTWQVSAAPEPITIEELRDEAAIASLQPLGAVGDDFVSLASETPGADGLAALTVLDFIGEPESAFESDRVRARKRRGLRALEAIGEVAAIAVPDIHIQPVRPPEHAPLPPCVPDPCLPQPPPGPAPQQTRAAGDLPPRFDDRAVFQVQAAMVSQCETRRDRIALLDPPYAAARDPRLGIAAIRAWRRQFDSTYAALYFPWLTVVDPLRIAEETTRAVPPSGHMAGFFATSDAGFGVHKAPANGRLQWLQDVTIAVSETEHGVLNDESINVVRSSAGRGLRILGARIATSDASWRFVNVRRLLIMIEKAIALATRWAIFEPNNAATRAKLHLSLTSFLLALWQHGALAGESPRAAFFVTCSDANNPPASRDRGWLLAEVGVAPALPFEFVVLRVGRDENRFEIEERGMRGGVR